MGDERSVLILGAGTMGHGIAVCFADAGWDVTLVDPSADALTRGIASMERALDLLSRVDGSPSDRRREAMGRTTTATALPERLPGTVIEAVPEQMDLKHRIYGDLEARCTSETLICTNTSGLEITSLAEGMRNPERFVGTHFWNPPYVLPCVEVIKGDATTHETVERAVDILRAIGRKPVRINEDVPGFVGTRLLHALQREALSLVERGVVSAGDLDEAVTQSLGLRMALIGPFERADLGGIDVTCRVQAYLLEHLERGTTPSALLTSKVTAGDLGAKTGQGFFTWAEDRARKRVEERDEILLRILKTRDRRAS